MNGRYPLSAKAQAVAGHAKSIKALNHEGHEEHKEELFFSFVTFVSFVVPFFSEPFATPSFFGQREAGGGP